MNAVMSKEPRVIAEDRIARIESDVAEIKDDVKVVNVRLNESIVANAREFGAARTELEKHRTETEKGFGAVRKEIEENKTATEKGFGGLRVEIEKNRTEMQAIRTKIESAKYWVVGTGIGIVATILGTLHTLKII